MSAAVHRNPASCCSVFRKGFGEITMEKKKRKDPAVVCGLKTSGTPSSDSGLKRTQVIIYVPQFLDLSKKSSLAYCNIYVPTYVLPRQLQ